MKSTVFSKELEYIKDQNNRDNAITLLELLPDYFYEIPASSSGKYHPDFALGTGGLVRHTKVAVKIASILLNNDSIGYSFIDNEKDLIIMALLIHDGLKKGYVEEEYTVFDHPLLIADFIKTNKEKLKFTDEEIELLADMVAAHMGQWNTNKYSAVELPVPSNKYQRFVHMCDYLSSQKFLDVEFDNLNIKV